MLMMLELPLLGDVIAPDCPDCPDCPDSGSPGARVAGRGPTMIELGPDRPELSGHLFCATGREGGDDGLERDHGSPALATGFT
jgi:hypothetical protein